MSCGGEAGKQWTCAKAGAASLQKVGLIVRDIGEPCLSQSPIKVVITVRLSSTMRMNVTKLIVVSCFFPYLFGLFMFLSFLFGLKCLNFIGQGP